MEVSEESHSYCVTGIAWNPMLPTPAPNHLLQHSSPPFSSQILSGKCACFCVQAYRLPKPVMSNE